MSEVDIDLDAIRERDRRWVDRGRVIDSTGRDRRILLQYILELEAIADQIDATFQEIKRIHRDGYQPKPQRAIAEAEILAAQTDPQP